MGRREVPMLTPTRKTLCSRNILPGRATNAGRKANEMASDRSLRSRRMSVLERQTRFRELLERSHARWAGIARAYAEVPDRDDLVQEIAMQVWQSLDRFAGRSSLDTWAYRVALNTALVDPHLRRAGELLIVGEAERT
jgi:hypothetical protein